MTSESAEGKSSLPVIPVKEVVRDFLPVTVSDKHFAVYQHEGCYYAIVDECPHEECLFSEYGALEDDALECTCHGSQFDPVSGENIVGPSWGDAAVYPLAVEGDTLTIPVQAVLPSE